jgi:hypothetical protein
VSKGSNRRPESRAGAFGDGYEAMNWGARDACAGSASAGREHNGGPSGNEGIGPQSVIGQPRGGAGHACISNRASGHPLEPLELAVVAFNLEYQAHIGASAELFDACKFEACQSALEEGCKALEAAKAAGLTIGMELSR